ncbi:MAG TPA: hypothetical protein DEB70_08290 [Planctomycetaceae bacterium]|nr:hypothetical protein [Planctomycetaceae bacterium]|tara:strand:- start:947 stop:1177 length:231 start_codon:yes stop_codon:yes gene_type:complete
MFNLKLQRSQVVLYMFADVESIRKVAFIQSLFWEQNPWYGYSFLGHSGSTLENPMFTFFFSLYCQSRQFSERFCLL